MWFGLSMFPKKRQFFEPEFDAGLQCWPQDAENSASLSSSEHSFVPGSAKNRAALWAVARDQRLKLCCPPPSPPASPCLLSSTLGAGLQSGLYPSHQQQVSQPLLHQALPGLSGNLTTPKDTKGTTFSDPTLSEGLFINPPFLTNEALQVSPVACLFAYLLVYLLIPQVNFFSNAFQSAL